MKFKKIIIITALLLVGCMFSFKTNAQTLVSNSLENNLIFADGFENIASLEEDDKFYSEYGIITTSDTEVISGEQSLKLQTLDSAGTYTTTLLTTEKDVVDITSNNSYKLSMKLKPYSFDELMIEVRYDWNTNTKESMPYEFGLFIDEEAKTVSRRPGWIPLEQLITYNERYSMDENGVISLSFNFIAEKEAVIEVKGKTGSEDFGYLIIDDYKLEKMPRMIETFEDCTADFWNSTAFWANQGNLVTDSDAIDGTSLKYVFTDNDPDYNVPLGGLTDIEIPTVIGNDYSVTFSVKGLPNAENFVFVLNGDAYYDFNLNLEDGTYNSTNNFKDIKVVNKDEYYEVVLAFNASESETNSFTFFGGGSLGLETGIVIDDFSIKLDEEKIYVTPVNNNIYNKADGEDLLYQVTINDDDFVLKNELGEVVDSNNYLYSEGLLTLSASYLDTLSSGEYTYIVENNSSVQKEFTFQIIDTRPSFVTEELEDYQASLKQHISVEVDLQGFYLDKVLVDDTNLSTDDYQFNDNSLTILNSYLETLELEKHTIKVFTSEGEASLDFNIVQGVEAIVDNEKEFNKGEQKSIIFDINIPIEDITDIKLDDNSLDSSYYNIEDSKLTIDKSFLSTLTKGSYDFIVITDYAQFEFTIKIIAEAPVVNGDTTKEFTKGKEEEVEFTIDTKGLPILSIENGENELTSDDYEINGNTLTINKNYLNNYLGELTLKVNTEGGQVELTIEIIVEAPVVEGDTTKEFTKGKDEGVEFTIDTKGLPILNIENGDNKLSTDDYQLDGNTLTINKNYLNNYSDELTLKVNTEGGQVELIINIETIENNNEFNLLYIIIPGGIIAIGLGALFIIKRKFSIV